MTMAKKYKFMAFEKENLQFAPRISIASCDLFFIHLNSQILAKSIWRYHVTKWVV